MNRALKLIALLVLATEAHAVIGPPAGNPILNSTLPQNAAFNVSSGTIRGRVTLPGLVAGCLTTDPVTGVGSQSCMSGGSGGGVSSLAVNQNGVKITSPTVAINALSPPFKVVSVNGGTTAQFTLDPSSVTLQGNQYSIAGIAADTGTLTNSMAAVRTSTTTLGAAVLSLTASTTTLGNSITNLAASTTTIGTQVSNLNASTTSIALAVTGLQASFPVSLSTGVTGNLQVGNLDNGTNANAGTFYCGNGHWSTPPSAVSMPLQVTKGGVEVTSPTYSINFTPGQFLLSPLTSTTVQVVLDASSVTLRGDAVIADVTAGVGLGISFSGGDPHHPVISFLGSASYISNQSTLQAGATAYPDFLDVGTSATIPSLGVSTLTATLITASTVTVISDPYGSSWTGSTWVPTKGALHDKIEALSAVATSVYSATATASFPYGLSASTVNASAFDSTSTSMTIHETGTFAERAPLDLNRPDLTGFSGGKRLYFDPSTASGGGLRLSNNNNTGSTNIISFQKSDGFTYGYIDMAPGAFSYSLRRSSCTPTGDFSGQCTPQLRHSISVAAPQSFYDWNGNLIYSASAPLTSSQFVKTGLSKELVSYDLLNATQTWTGAQTVSSMTVTNLNVTGTCTNCGSGGTGGSGVVVPSTFTWGSITTSSFTATIATVPTLFTPGLMVRFSSACVTSSSGSAVTSQYAATNLAATITPRQATDFIKLEAFTGQARDSAAADCYFSFLKGSPPSTTDITATTKGLGYVGTSGTDLPITLHWTDLPNTTSATTYTVGIRSGSGTCTWNIQSQTTCIYVYDYSQQ